MQTELLSQNDYKVMPWKNGQGSTVEFIIDPPTSTVTDVFSYRLSSATVNTSGPFSQFSGYSRVLIPIEGPPIKILHNNIEKTLNRLDKYAFKGDLDTKCEIKDTVRDFNVITKDDRCSATVEVIRISSSNNQNVVVDGICYIFVVNGKINNDDITANTNEIVVIRGLGNFEFKGDAEVIITHIKMLDF